MSRCVTRGCSGKMTVVLFFSASSGVCPVSDPLPFGLDHVFTLDWCIHGVVFIFAFNSSCALPGLCFGIFGTFGSSGSEGTLWGTVSASAAQLETHRKQLLWYHMGNGLRFTIYSLKLFYFLIVSRWGKKASAPLKTQLHWLDKRIWVHSVTLI